MGDRVLVTGGAGFIGSHLCERLLARGDEVICLDNFFTGSKANVAHLMSEPRFELLRHDIVEPILVEVDRVFNLACPASPVHYQQNPVKTIKASVLGALHVLGLAKRVNARLVQASTSEVYGDPFVHPQPEAYWGNVNPIGPRSCYDEGKRAAEALCAAYRLQNDVDVRIARIFNTYGPRMALEDGRVVSNFIVQALRAQPLMVYGDGTQTRSLCFVDDLVDGLLRLMDSDDEALSAPTNLGNPEELSVMRVAELVLELTGSRSAIEYAPAVVDDPRQRRPDIAKAERILGWKPRVSVRTGLARTIEYLRHAVAARS